MFESSVNSYSTETGKTKDIDRFAFESSVNSYSTETYKVEKENNDLFESSVNSYSTETIVLCLITLLRLRVV